MSNDAPDELPLRWRKLRVLSGIIASILIPFVIALVGNSVNTIIKESELGLRYVELAVGLLREEPRSETENLRKWAIDIVNKYADVKLTKEAKTELKSEKLLQGKTHLPENMRDGAAMPLAAFERAEQSLKKLSALIDNEKLKDVSFPADSSLEVPADTDTDKKKEYNELIKNIAEATNEKTELETSIPPLLTEATREPAEGSPGGLFHSSEKEKLVEFENKWGGLFSAREVASDRLSIDKANAAIMLQQAEAAEWVEKYDKLRQALDKKIKAVADLKKKNEVLNEQAAKFVKQQ